MTIALRSRRIITDNLGTRNHPVPRHRIATPLTPRRVRLALIEAPEWLETDKAAEWLEERRGELAGMLTPLDLMLTDEEAWALERFIANEELLAGNARCSNWTGERVQTSAAHVAPLHDNELDALDGHTAFRRRLGQTARGILLIFFAQQTAMDGAPDDGQAAALLGMIGGRKGCNWWSAVKQCAQGLVAMGY
jgi:hypothetical protein